MARDDERMDHDPDETVGYVIGVGGWLGALLHFLGGFQRPVVALRGRHLYRVLLEGSGFELPVEGADAEYPNPTGFFTTRFVAAPSRLDAEAAARRRVLAEWQGLSLLDHFTGIDEPVLRVCATEAMDGWFRLRPGRGFSFFHADPAD